MARDDLGQVAGAIMDVVNWARDVKGFTERALGLGPAVGSGEVEDAE